MTQEIDNKISQLKKNVDDSREMLASINNEIENKNFRPNESQKAEINYILSRGQESLKEIERLEELNNRTY